jgi:hypothetical protein
VVTNILLTAITYQQDASLSHSLETLGFPTGFALPSSTGKLEFSRPFSSSIPAQRSKLKNLA